MRTNIRTGWATATLLAGSAIALVVAATPATAAPTATAVPAIPTPMSLTQAMTTAHPDVHGVVRGAAVRAQTANQVSTFLDAHAGLVNGPLVIHPNATQIHPAQGTAFVDKGNDQGSFATQSVTTNLKPANGGTTIYTPTMFSAGGSCIEITTVYTSVTQAVEAWDWCVHINFEAAVPINSAFLTRYTNGTGAYTAEILRTNASNNTWTGYLFDYTTNTYDTLFTSTGTTQAGTTGWDVNELYSNVMSNGQSFACSDLAGKTFSANNIQVDLGGTWTAAAPSNSDTRFNQPASAFDCQSMSFQMISQYNHWQVTG
jgi:hypothetical protein